MDVAASCGATHSLTHFAEQLAHCSATRLLHWRPPLAPRSYVSDVTRTWPINGRFSPAQRDVYDAVLEVHQRCVRVRAQGARGFGVHHQRCEHVWAAQDGVGGCTRGAPKVRA
jgi:hypothetical protein